jgi:hypothetical protein
MAVCLWAMWCLYPLLGNNSVNNFPRKRVTIGCRC